MCIYFCLYILAVVSPVAVISERRKFNVWLQFNVPLIRSMKIFAKNFDYNI